MVMREQFLFLDWWWITSYTSVAKGDESSVKTNNNISVKYVVHPSRKDYFYQKITVNGSVVKRTDIYKEKIPKSVDIKYLF